MTSERFANRSAVQRLALSQYRRLGSVFDATLGGGDYRELYETQLTDPDRFVAFRATAVVMKWPANSCPEPWLNSMMTDGSLHPR